MSDALIPYTLRLAFCRHAMFGVNRGSISLSMSQVAMGDKSLQEVPSVSMTIPSHTSGNGG